MEYGFFNQDDQVLIDNSELPVEGGIAFAVRTTGYDTDRDEVVELAIVDLQGELLFSQRVKPQNVENWQASDASGGIGPSDVAESSELFQFEDEIVELFEKATVVVCQHLAFARDAIESSWVSLPKFEGIDIVSLFCQSHSALDYPGQAAAVAALPGIAAYYGLPEPDGTAAGEATSVAACYSALVREHMEQREAKGDAYWQRYEEGKAAENSEEERRKANARMREHRMNQMNALLWIAGAIIFTSLAIQLSQRGADMGIIVISGALAVLAFARGIINFRK